MLLIGGTFLIWEVLRCPFEAVTCGAQDGRLRVSQGSAAPEASKPGLCVGTLSKHRCISVPGLGAWLPQEMGLAAFNSILLLQKQYFFFFFQNQPLLPLIPNPSPQLSDKQIRQPPAVSVWVIPTRTLATLDLILSPAGGIHIPLSP